MRNKIKGEEKGKKKINKREEIIGRKNQETDKKKINKKVNKNRSKEK